MSRRAITSGIMTLALVSGAATQAHAQWGYPGGYGGYGWGGWGASTAQGDMARGLGVYAAGAGYYNQQTAVANSINADTVMRWNQYVYESQKEANRLHHGKLAQDRLNNINATNQIRDRLRNNPEQLDIRRGDALNLALEEISDPRVYAKALQGADVKIGGDTIRNIPFQYAAAAITVSVHQLVQGGPPKSLLVPQFEPIRTELKALGKKVRGQIEHEEKLDPKDIDRMLELINQAEAEVDGILPRNSRDRNEADRYLKALHGLIAMLKTPALDVILAGVENRPEATLGELVNFMNAFNLRFGPANTPQQRMIYDSLYPKLVALRDQVAPALAAAAPAHTPSSGKAPGDFFSGMNYEDLQKKAPAPPKPNP